MKSDPTTMFPWLFNAQTPCACPVDSLSPECNSAQNFYFDFFYDISFNYWNTVYFGFEMRKTLIAGRTARSSAGVVIGAYNVLQDRLWKVIAAGGIFKSNLDFRVAERNNIRIPPSFTVNGTTYNNSWANNMTLTELLQSEFQQLCQGKCATISFNMRKNLGRTDFSFMLNKMNFQLQFLVTNATYVSVSGSTSRKQRVASGQTSAAEARASNMIASMQVPATMCTDTITQARAMSRLINRPPVPLIEEFYKCRKTLIYAMWYTVGGTFTSSTVYVTFCWLLFGFVAVRLARLLLPSGAVLPSATDMEALRKAEYALEREKLTRVLDGLKRFVDGKASPGEIHQHIDSLTSTYRAFTGCGDSADVETAGREVSQKLEHGWLTGSPGDAALLGGAARRITLFAGDSPMMQRRSTYKRNSMSVAQQQQFSADGRRISLSAHPLEMVLSNTRAPAPARPSLRPIPPSFDVSSEARL